MSGLTPDIWSPAKRSEVMSRIRGEDTGPEISLRRALYSMGLRYRVHPSDLPGRPDIVFSRARVAVFVHGCFWHGCPQHYSAPISRRGFWKRKLTDNRRRDSRHRTTLQRKGWRVIEIWEHEVDSDPAACAKRVIEIVKGRI